LIAVQLLNGLDQYLVESRDILEQVKDQLIPRRQVYAELVQKDINDALRSKATHIMYTCTHQKSSISDTAVSENDFNLQYGEKLSLVIHGLLETFWMLFVMDVRWYSSSFGTSVDESLHEVYDSFNDTDAILVSYFPGFKGILNQKELVITQ
jgi:hypothetical protein